MGEEVDMKEAQDAALQAVLTTEHWEHFEKQRQKVIRLNSKGSAHKSALLQQELQAWLDNEALADSHKQQLFSTRYEEHIANQRKQHTARAADAAADEWLAQMDSRVVTLMENPLTKVALKQVLLIAVLYLAGSYHAGEWMWFP